MVYCFLFMVLKFDREDRPGKPETINPKPETVCMVVVRH